MRFIIINMYNYSLHIHYTDQSVSLNKIVDKCNKSACQISYISVMHMFMKQIQEIFDKELMADKLLIIKTSQCYVFDNIIDPFVEKIR